MKDIIISEEKLKSVDKLTLDFFYDDNDPRSTKYNRYLVRPKPNIKKILIYLFIPILLIALYIETSFLYNTNLALVVLLVFVLYVIATLKNTIITLIELYQYYAPDGIRKKCKFEPSCSTYVILAVSKYGVIKGMIKGIKRLKRCKGIDGGIDYP